MTWKKTKQYLFCLLFFLSFIITFYFSVRMFDATKDFLGKVALNSGYGLKKISISGNRIIQREEVYNIASEYINRNSFNIPIWQIKKRLEQIPWCKSAVVIKKLPNELIIKISEHKPFAVFNETEIITNDFKPIITYNHNLHSYLNLLQINSSDIWKAKRFIKTLRRVLPAEIFSQVKSADHISNRRWDITFSDDILVKLPEDHLNIALQSLIKIYQKQKNLNEKMSIIDLRIYGKVFIST